MRKLLMGAIVMTLSIATNAATLTAKEAAIVDIGEATARGEQDKLAEAFKAGFDAGLTLNEAKERVGQLYAYCGFPRALNAAATLMSAWGTGNREWGTGKSPTPFESDYNALRSGMAKLARTAVGVLFDCDPIPLTDDDIIKIFTESYR